MFFRTASNAKVNGRSLSELVNVIEGLESPCGVLCDAHCEGMSSFCGAMTGQLD